MQKLHSVLNAVPPRPYAGGQWGTQHQSALAGGLSTPPSAPRLYTGGGGPPADCIRAYALIGGYAAFGLYGPRAFARSQDIQVVGMQAGRMEG